jgi:hypothetical protein
MNKEICGYAEMEPRFVQGLLPRLADVQEGSQDVGAVR